MSNHFHHVLRNRPDRAAEWSSEEVARRWLEIFPNRRCMVEDGETPSEEAVRELLDHPDRLTVLRARLADISWFMRALDEWIARRANAEDGCTGRFWEGRFRCKRLMDEATLLVCMSYVDLNPIRARMCDDLRDAEFTSAFDRLKARQARIHRDLLQAGGVTAATVEPPATEIVERLDAEIAEAGWLVDLDGPQSPFSFLGESEYLRLLDETGRRLREDKPGAIAPDVLPILEALGLEARRWTEAVRGFRSLFGPFAGRAETLRELARDKGRHHFKGCVCGQDIYRNPSASKVGF